MALSFPASPSDGDVYTNTTTGVKYIYNATDGVWKTQVFPTNTDYLQLTGGTLTGNLSLGTNDLTAQDINSTTLTTTGAVTVGNGLTVSAGNVVMSNGAGIDFSATADSSGTLANELLDDYEEGTFDVSVGMTGSGSVTLNTSYATMSYTKIGRLVTITGSIRISSVSSPAGNIQISTLPFTVAAGTKFARSSGAVYYFDTSAGAGYYYKLVPGRVLESTTVFDILVYHWENTLIPAASDEIHVGFTYITP